MSRDFVIKPRLTNFSIMNTLIGFLYPDTYPNKTQKNRRFKKSTTVIFGINFP